jgi:hypothetical protein
MATPHDAPYKLKQRELKNTARWFYKSGYTLREIGGQLVPKGIPYIKQKTE